MSTLIICFFLYQVYILPPPKGRKKKEKSGSPYCSMLSMPYEYSVAFTKFKSSPRYFLYFHQGIKLHFYNISIKHFNFFKFRLLIYIFFNFLEIFIDIDILLLIVLLAFL